MKRMKIVHVCLSGSWSGSEIVAAELANGLADRHDVGMVFADAGNVPQRFYKDRLAENVRYTLVTGRPNDEKVEAAVRSLFEADPDILHAHLGPACRTISRICPASVTIGHMHMRYFDAQHGKLDGVIAIAPWQVKDIAPHYHGYVSLVPNFHQTPRSTKDKLPKKDLRYMLGLSADQRLIGSVGRLHADKGIDILIESMRLLNNPEVHLLLFGAGPQETVLRGLAQNLPNVHFLGFRHDVSELVKGVDLYISASRSEPFGLATLEAMTAGTSVVASRTLGSSWLLEHLDDRLFAIEDIYDTTRTIEKFIDGPSETPDYRLDRFSRAQSLQKLEQAYVDILDVAVSRGTTQRSA